MLPKQILMLCLFFIIFTYSSENNNDTYPEDLLQPKNRQEINAIKDQQLQFIDSRFEKLHNSDPDCTAIFEEYNEKLPIWMGRTFYEEDIINLSNPHKVKVHDLGDVSVYKLKPESEPVYFLFSSLFFTIWKKNPDNNTFVAVQLPSLYHNNPLYNENNGLSLPLSAYFQKRVIDYEFHDDGIKTHIVRPYNENLHFSNLTYCYRMNNLYFTTNDKRKAVYYIGRNKHRPQSRLQVITIQDIMAYRIKKIETVSSIRQIAKHQLKYMDY
jgi:hypothetical protein